MNDNDLYPSGLHVIQQSFKRWSLGNLLASGTSLIIFIKDWHRQPPQRTPILDGPLLCVNTVVVFLHLAGTPYIASDNHTRRLRTNWLLDHLSLLYLTSALITTRMTWHRDKRACTSLLFCGRVMSRDYRFNCSSIPSSLSCKDG